MWTKEINDVFMNTPCQTTYQGLKHYYLASNILLKNLYRNGWQKIAYD